MKKIFTVRLYSLFALCFFCSIMAMDDLQKTTVIQKPLFLPISVLYGNKQYKISVPIQQNERGNYFFTRQDVATNALDTITYDKEKEENIKTTIIAMLSSEENAINQNIINDIKNRNNREKNHNKQYYVFSISDNAGNSNQIVSFPEVQTSYSGEFFNTKLILGAINLPFVIFSILSLIQKYTRYSFFVPAS